MKHVIIGGVAGGATAAARIRRNDESAEIVIFEKGKYISYANCGLPYYIGGVINEREKLILQTPTSFGNRYDVEVRVESEVIAIDREGKSIIVRNASGKEYRESYDRLLLSPGAIPIIPDFALNEDKTLLPGVFTIRNVADIDNVKQYLLQNNVQRATVIGAGFIGLEMAENLQKAGAEVSIVEMSNQVMPPLDFDTAALVSGHLRQKGVQLFLSEKVVSIVTTGSSPLTINCESGKSIETEFVILSIGVQPLTSLAREAGIEIGTAKGIKVNSFLQTSDENIFAVGDAIEFPHPITGKSWLNYLAGPANRQARIAADNMVYGNKVQYEGSIGTAVAKIFDLTAAATGLSSKKLEQKGIVHFRTIIHSASHAGYYPNSSQITLKLCYNPEDGKLFGAQGVGSSGIDKRIDQIALVIKNGGTIYDLTTVEHCYAPPFSSAKDPIAIAGYVAENTIRGRMRTISWEEIKSVYRSKVTILDVRSPEETKLGIIEGATLIPLDELRFRLDEIPVEKPVYIYCAIGLRGYLASRILLQNDYSEVFNLSGGYRTYKACVSERTCLTKNEL